VNSWASIAQSDSNLLEAGKSRDQILVEARFSTPGQTGPVGHPASHTMGTGSFPGVKWPGRGVDQPPHPPSPSGKVQERVELYIYSPLGFLA
jgi:hypothetical protein